MGKGEKWVKAKHTFRQVACVPDVRGQGPIDAGPTVREAVKQIYVWVELRVGGG